MRDRLSIEEYRDELLRLVTRITDVETVSLGRADGRTLAAPVTAAAAVPVFANSAMDGFAVHETDRHRGAELSVVGTVAAGSPLDPAMAPGECVRIMTGAPLPSQADAVVPVELTEESGGIIRIVEEPGGKTHVRAAGEDFSAGAEVLPAGLRLGPRALGVAAACGRGEVTVVRRPRVAVIATGDELRPAGAMLTRGQIYESNGTFMAGQLIRMGAEVVAAPVLPDEPGSFAAGLEAAAAGADLVVLSGGVSVGDHDVVRQVLGGEIGSSAAVRSRFVHVVMQPGKPQGWALWRAGEREVPLVALPGNPLSTMVSCELFVEPLLDAMLGRVPRSWLRAVVGSPWPAPRGRRQVVPVIVETDETGRLVVVPAHEGISASHLVSAAARADGLALLDEPTDNVRPGDLVSFRRYL